MKHHGSLTLCLVKRFCLVLLVQPFFCISLLFPSPGFARECAQLLDESNPILVAATKKEPDGSVHRQKVCIYRSGKNTTSEIMDEKGQLVSRSDATGGRLNRSYHSDIDATVQYEWNPDVMTEPKSGQYNVDLTVHFNAESRRKIKVSVEYADAEPVVLSGCTLKTRRMRRVDDLEGQQSTQVDMIQSAQYDIPLTSTAYRIDNRTGAKQLMMVFTAVDIAPAAEARALCRLGL